MQSLSHTLADLSGSSSAIDRLGDVERPKTAKLRPLQALPLPLQDLPFDFLAFPACPGPLAMLMPTYLDSRHYRPLGNSQQLVFLGEGVTSTALSTASFLSMA
jgi:hypothetical protein